MPQLDPSPWFLIILSSWMIFIILSPIKVANYSFLNDPFNKTYKGLNNPWTWPWL